MDGISRRTRAPAAAQTPFILKDFSRLVSSDTYKRTEFCRNAAPASNIYLLDNVIWWVALKGVSGAKLRQTAVHACPLM